MSDNDYIKTPEHRDDKVYINDSLLHRLRDKIDKDLCQIEGVYNDRISDEEKECQIQIEKIKEYTRKKIEAINHERERDIAKYNSEAEKKIENILESITDNKDKNNFWSYLGF